VLFKFTDAFSGTMTAPFVMISLSRKRLCRDRQGVGLAATLIGGFAALRGAALFAGRKPVDRRRAAGGRQSLLLLARAERRRSMGAGVPITAENFTSAIGTVIFVAYLSRCARPAAHRDPVRTTHRARRGRTHLSVVRRRLCGEGDRMAAVLRDLRRGRGAEPDAADVAAAAKAF